MVIGIGVDEYFIGSDATPIIEYTNKVTYMGEEEIVTIRRNGPLKIKTIGNIEKTPQIQQLELTLGQLEKGEYPHFMLKEIFEQPHSLSDCMRGRVNVDKDNITLAGFIDNREKFLSAKRIIITACGTSWHAAQMLKEISYIHAEGYPAAEMKHGPIALISNEMPVIAIATQSETYEKVLGNIQEIKARKGRIIGCGVDQPRNLAKSVTVE